jgi:hypothetical protein
MKFLLLTFALALSACEPKSDLPSPHSLRGNKPDLNWQKSSESILRGNYFAQEAIQKSEIRQIGESLCLKTPEIDPRLKAGVVSARYTEMSPSQGGTVPFRLLDVFKITEGTALKIGFDESIWYTQDNGKLGFYTRSGESTKVNLFGDGKYYTNENSNEIRGGTAPFPEVEQSPLLQDLIESLKSRADYGEEFTIGKFQFGNGEVTKAASALQWNKFGDGSAQVSIGVLIPLASQAHDLGCAPEVAYAAMVQISANGAIAFKIEQETLHTTAH